MNPNQTTPNAPREAGAEGPWELSESQIEKIVCHFPLPALESQEQEIARCQTWIETRTRSIACSVLGLSDRNLKREWAIFRKEEAQADRFRAFLTQYSGRWDAARGKYLFMRNPWH